MMKAAVGLAAFDGKRYLSLETYRKSGKGVRTPVWFAVEPTNAPAPNPRKLYVFTATDSGKAKRIRQKGVVKIAPCDARGNASAARSSAAVWDFNRKYCPWKQILDLSVLLFRRPERIMLAIRPVLTRPDPSCPSRQR
jgi:PPOX class probable F420-dependent enzyme